MSNDKLIEEAFADVLFSQLINNETADPLLIPKFFTQLSSEKDLEYYFKKALNKNFRLETQLWSLVDKLISKRLGDYHKLEAMGNSTNDLVTKFGTNASHIENLLSNDVLISDIWTIMAWIRSNLMKSEELASETIVGNKWINTKLALQQNNIARVSMFGKQQDSKSWMIQELDYDAPFRENKKLDPRDSQNDLKFFKKLYYLILAREHQEALELCESTDNWTYFMILQGLNGYIDPVLDSPTVVQGDVEQSSPQGIKNVYLWRRNCLRLSQNCENEYAQSLFEFLAGGITKNVKMNQGNWETTFLVYLNSFLTSKFEKYLIDIKKVENNEPLEIPELSKIHDINDILVEISNFHSLRELSQNNFRLLMGSIMLNNVNDFIDNFLSLDYNAKILKSTESGVYSDLDDEILDSTPFDDVQYRDDEGDYEEMDEELEEILQKNPNYDNYNVYLLRVLTHLAIYLKIIQSDSVSDEQMTSLIKLYLKRLFKKSMHKLIPVYIKFLPMNNFEEVRRIYSYYLSKIITRENRIEQIEKCQQLDIIGFKDILLDTVELISEKCSNYYLSYINQSNNNDLFIIDDEVSDTDRLYWSSLVWLLLSNQHQHAIRHANEIFTKFLLGGKLNSLVEFYYDYDFKDLLKKADLGFDILSSEINNDESIVEEYKNNRRYLLTFLNLLENGFIVLREYEQFIVQNGLNKNGDNVWKTRVAKEEIVTKFINPLKNLILNILINIEVNEDDQVNELLKNLYVPHFVISLHKIFVSLRVFDGAKPINDFVVDEKPSFLKQAIQLSVLVANSSNNLIQYFMSSNRLKEYLKLIAECSALAGEDTIYD